jgi:hypothetical protein
LQLKAGGHKAAGEAGQIVDAEFDFSFDGHGVRQFLVQSS